MKRKREDILKALNPCAFCEKRCSCKKKSCFVHDAFVVNVSYDQVSEDYEVERVTFLTMRHK